MNINIGDYARYNYSSCDNVLLFKVKDINEYTLGDGEDYYPVESCEKITQKQFNDIMESWSNL